MSYKTSRIKPNQKSVDLIDINEVNENVSYLLLFRFLSSMCKSPYKKETLEIRARLDRLFPGKEPLFKLGLVKFKINEETIRVTNFCKNKDIRRINYKAVELEMQNATMAAYMVICKGYDAFPRAGHILEYALTYDIYYDEHHEQAVIESYNIFTNVIDYKDYLILYGFDALQSFHKSYVL